MSGYSVVKPRRVFTLHRRGELVIDVPHPAKCAEPDWRVFDYKVSIRALAYLDEQGFVIDHNKIHDRLNEQACCGVLNGSCERLCLLIAKQVEGCCHDHGTVVIGIHVKVRPRNGVSVAPHSWTEYDVEYPEPINGHKCEEKRA